MQVEFRRRIDEMTQYQEDEIKDAAATGKTTYQNSRRILFMVTLLVLVTSIAFAILTTRSITARVTEAMNVTQSVASGDLGKPVESHSTDELGRLLSALEKMRSDLANAVGAIRSGAYAVRDGAQEITKGNSHISSRTEQQASSLEETAAAMEELTAAVKQNAQGTREVNQMAIDASGVAAKGAQSVRDVVATINEISESSRKIADIISVIDGIAFQTNILALNAAVEAARAGEQGRGFAVVATEVRSLAQRSAIAAKEIKALIEDSAGRVDKGTTLATGAGKNMDDIIRAVSEVTKRVSGIATANEQQLAGIEQINNAVSQMEQMVQQSAALVEQSAAAAEHMAGQAESLSDSVSRFKLSEDRAQIHASTAPIATASASQFSMPATQPSTLRRPEKLPRSPTAAGVLAAVHKHKTARRNDGEDGEWKEF